MPTLRLWFIAIGLRLSSLTLSSTSWYDFLLRGTTPFPFSFFGRLLFLLLQEDHPESVASRGALRFFSIYFPFGTAMDSGYVTVCFFSALDRSY